MTDATKPEFAGSPEAQLFKDLVSFWVHFRADASAWAAGMKDAEREPGGGHCSGYFLPEVAHDVTRLFMQFAVEKYRRDPSVSASALMAEIYPDPERTSHSSHTVRICEEPAICLQLSGIWEVQLQESWERAKKLMGKNEPCAECREYDSTQDISPATNALKLPDDSSVREKLKEQIEAAIEQEREHVPQPSTEPPNGTPANDAARPASRKRGDRSRIEDPFDTKEKREAAIQCARPRFQTVQTLASGLGVNYRDLRAWARDRGIRLAKTRSSKVDRIENGLRP